MDITVTRALKLLREIKSVTFATVNQGRPDARIIDVAHVDGDGLYFITARGKPFYDQLIEHGDVAICGMNKNYTTVRIIGDIKKCEGREIVDKLFDLNDFPYPGDTRDIIDTGHCIECGRCREICTEDAIERALGL